MSLAHFIDILYRQACVAHGTTPIVRRICMSPEHFRDFANETRGTSRLNWYSDGRGPHYMGMFIYTAPICDLVILQGQDGEVVTAGIWKTGP